MEVEVVVDLLDCRIVREAVSECEWPEPRLEAVGRGDLRKDLLGHPEVGRWMGDGGGHDASFDGAWLELWLDTSAGRSLKERIRAYGSARSQWSVSLVGSAPPAGRATEVSG